jgi:hypothetical protein
LEASDAGENLATAIQGVGTTAAENLATAITGVGTTADRNRCILAASGGRRYRKITRKPRASARQLLGTRYSHYWRRDDAAETSWLQHPRQSTTKLGPTKPLQASARRENLGTAITGVGTTAAENLCFSYHDVGTTADRNLATLYADKSTSKLRTWKPLHPNTEALADARDAS